MHRNGRRSIQVITLGAIAVFYRLTALWIMVVIPLGKRLSRRGCLRLGEVVRTFEWKSNRSR
jgi:hypothetical protein